MNNAIPMPNRKVMLWHMLHCLLSCDTQFLLCALVINEPRTCASTYRHIWFLCTRVYVQVLNAIITRVRRLQVSLHNLWEKSLIPNCYCAKRADFSSPKNLSGITRPNFAALFTTSHKIRMWKFMGYLL